MQIREHLKFKYGTENTDGFKKSKSKQDAESDEEMDQSKNKYSEDFDHYFFLNSTLKLDNLVVCEERDQSSKQNKQKSKVVQKKPKKTTPIEKAVSKSKKTSKGKDKSDEESSRDSEYSNNNEEKTSQRKKSNAGNQRSSSNEFQTSIENNSRSTGFQGNQNDSLVLSEEED